MKAKVGLNSLTGRMLSPVLSFYWMSQFELKELFHEMDILKECKIKSVFFNCALMVFWFSKFFNSLAGCRERNKHYALLSLYFFHFSSLFCKSGQKKTLFLKMEA
jgi:hypothetical protein